MTWRARAISLACTAAVATVITAAPAASAAPATVTVKAVVRVESTSDWTWVQLANTTVTSARKVTADRQVHSLSYAARTISFSLSTADVAAHTFRAVSYAFTLKVTAGKPLRVGIMRGCLGTTAVALYNAKGRSAVRVGEVEGTGCSGVSWSTFDVARLITSKPTLVPPPGCAGAAVTDNASTKGAPRPGVDPNPNILIAQDNLWFNPLAPSTTSPITPALGFYDTASRSVNEATIELSSSHGIDALSQEWIAPAGEPGSLEGDLDGAFLAARNLCRTRWAIFYDLNLRLQWKYGITDAVDFSDPRVRGVFVSDFVHFAEKYFGGPYYLRLDGRPMVEIWATSGFTGDVDGAVAAARAAVAAKGYDVYIVGDEQTAQVPDRARIARWDAVTSFIPLLMPGSPYVGKDHGTAGLSDVAGWLNATSDAWSAAARGVTAKGGTAPVSIQPGFAPQYDDTRYRAANHIPGPTSLVAMSKQDVVALARVAYAHAVPTGASQRRIVWIGTWNNYPEHTQIEPSIGASVGGQAYPLGNTGTDIVDALVSVFGGSTFGHP